MSNSDFDYLRDPDAIYAASFAAIEHTVNLTEVATGLHDVALRLVHAVGDPDLIDAFTASDGAGQAGRAALQAGAPVLTDSRMLADGIIRSRLPAQNRVICTLGLGSVAGNAKRAGTTRSAAAVELWAPFLGGAVVAIGNAPTALFRLLEGLALGWPKPALIIGLPVGYIGAAESKEALVAAAPAPFITLRGRRGGSPLAAAAVNALAKSMKP
ncbi:MAG: precorrin-8X methylmutase [Alphaproteobacteria bacterium]